MRLLSGITGRLRSIASDAAARARSLFSLLLGRSEDRELADEIRFHIEKQTEKNLAAGMSPEEARRRAHIELGGVERTREKTREARGIAAMEDVMRDVRLALRSMIRSPVHTLAVVLTLGVGIGAVTAVFSTVDHVLFRPLPYDEPGRVVTLWETDAQSGARTGVAPGTFLEWADRSTVFESIGLAEQWSSDLDRVDAPPEEVPVWRVDDGFMDALGARVMLGRGFLPEEFRGIAYSNAALGVIRDHTGTGRSILISEEFWRSRFGADSTVIGRTLELDGVARTVVGVLAAEMDYPQERPIWAPKLYSDLERSERTGGFMNVVGRLRPGVTVDQARAEMERIAGDLSREYPVTNAEKGVELLTLEGDVLGEARGALLLLLGAVGFLLAVACANVAGMTLARGSSRKHEMAVRSALGARRGRLVGQLVTENLVVGILGGLLGLMLAWLALRGLALLGPESLPRVDAVVLDGRILLFAVVATALSALASGLLPAHRITGVASNVALRRGGTAGDDRSGIRSRNALVVGQIAVALALFVGAGLLGRSFVSMLGTDLGFDTEGRAVVQAFIWDRNPLLQDRIRQARQMAREMESLPGVESVAVASAVPFHPFGFGIPQAVEVVDRPPPPSGQELLARPNIVSPEYFETLSIPMRAGRPFTEQDRLDSPPVALINETMARTFFSGEDPLGERIVATLPYTQNRVDREIVGIVADVRNRTVDREPLPEVYIPFAQNGFGGVIFVARSSVAGAGDGADGLVAAMRNAIWEVDPGQSIYHSATLDQLVSDTLGPQRFSLFLLGGFALTGLVLVGIGIYGTVSYATSRRTREIGIRMALGSDRSEILSMVLRQGLRIGFMGVGLGIVLALILTRFMETLLYQVRPTDPLVYTAVATFMLLLTAAATWAPAHRSARYDPVRTLREG